MTEKIREQKQPQTIENHSNMKFCNKIQRNSIRVENKYKNKTISSFKFILAEKKICKNKKALV